MIEDMLRCLGNPTVYMREVPSIHFIPRTAWPLSLHLVRRDLEFRSTPLGPFFPANTVSEAVTQTLTGLDPLSTSAFLVFVLIS